MIELKLKTLAYTESEDGSWEIITNSFEKDKDIRLLFFDEKTDETKTLNITYRELTDLINFLDKLQGRI